jgi:hypothetical protein
MEPAGASCVRAADAELGGLYDNEYRMAGDRRNFQFATSSKSLRQCTGNTFAEIWGVPNERHYILGGLTQRFAPNASDPIGVVGQPVTIGHKAHAFHFAPDVDRLDVGRQLQKLSNRDRLKHANGLLLCKASSSSPY